MSKRKMNLQQFVDRHGLQVKGFSVQGPYGELYQAASGEWLYFRRGAGYRKFNPVTQAKQVIEAIGLSSTAPTEEIKSKQDRRALLVVRKADGWYVADKAGPFKTRELARMARERLKNNQ